MSDQEVTLGEVYRALKRQDSVLEEIRVEVRATNGTVGRHETRISLLEAAAPKDESPSKSRTGLTLSLTGGTAVALWELIKKAFNL
jgi:hypothetical protein